MGVLVLTICLAIGVPDKTIELFFTPSPYSPPFSAILRQPLSERPTKKTYSIANRTQDSNIILCNYSMLGV